MLLIRLRGCQLEPELTSGLPLLGRQLAELWTKPSVRLAELGHLRIAQAEARLRQLGDALAKLLLQHRPVGIRCGPSNWLANRRGSGNRKCERGSE